MAKEGSSKKSKKAAVPKSAETPMEPAAKPGLKAYVVAVWQLGWGWLKRHKRLVLLAGVLLLIGLSLLILAAWRDHQEFTNDEMVIRVSRELNISGDANPAILDVTDEQKVSQPFLEGAKNGDKVLLYYKAGKSVLFRPTSNSIVRSGTFHAPDAKVFIRQGTADESKVATTQDKLKSIAGIDLASQDVSTKKDYSKTYVIDVTDRYNEQAAKIAAALGAEQIRLPRGETIPDADILVIVGAQ